MFFCPHHFILLYNYPFFFQCTPYSPLFLGSLILTAVEYYIVWIHPTVNLEVWWWTFVLFPKLHFTFCTRAFPRPLEELMCCRVWKSWTSLVIVTFSPKVIQQNFTPNFCLSNSIWEFLFLYLLIVLLVLPEVSLVWNLVVVKLYLSVISSNSFFITSETEQLFIFTAIWLSSHINFYFVYF